VGKEGCDAAVAKRHFYLFCVLVCSQTHAVDVPERQDAEGDGFERSGAAQPLTPAGRRQMSLPDCSDSQDPGYMQRAPAMLRQQQRLASDEKPVSGRRCSLH